MVSKASVAVYFAALKIPWLAAVVASLGAVPLAPARSQWIEKIVSEVSQERIGEILRKLESFGTRYAFDEEGNESLVTADLSPPRQRVVYQVY